MLLAAAAVVETYRVPIFCAIRVLCRAYYAVSAIWCRDEHLKPKQYSTDPSRIGTEKKTLRFKNLSIIWSKRMFFHEQSKNSKINLEKSSLNSRCYELRIAIHETFAFSRLSGKHIVRIRFCFRRWICEMAWKWFGSVAARPAMNSF